MKPDRQSTVNNESLDEDAPEGGVFYRCETVNGCGLRFPVTLTDPFRGNCPRCGGTVQLVARAETQVGVNNPAALGSRYPHSNLHLLLDNWRSLFNVGAAFRTAD